MLEKVKRLDEQVHVVEPTAVTSTGVAMWLAGRSVRRYQISTVGFSSAQLREVFLNLANFGQRELGFMTD